MRMQSTAIALQEREIRDRVLLMHGIGLGIVSALKGSGVRMEEIDIENVLRESAHGLAVAVHMGEEALELALQDTLQYLFDNYGDEYVPEQ